MLELAFGRAQLADEAQSEVAVDRIATGFERERRIAQLPEQRGV